ncbi:N-terminal domain of NEFA-interacting nuclear protein NIP30 domain-containing protein [Trichoderma sp. SZMC 28014]
MSGRFVSGGTITSSGEATKDESGHEAVVAAAREPLMKKNSEWEAVQHELEEDRKKREQARADLAGEGQQSLYDVLQANKAAKQAAFEEQAKLKNQFRALDNDEIDFLDEVRAKEKAEEARAKKELETGLKAFRERQKSTGGEASAGANEGEASREGEDEEWAVGGRKRKRHEREMLGVKKKVVSKGGEKEGAVAVSQSNDDDDGGKKSEREPQKEERERGEEKKPATGLGLVGYGSDSDED